MLRRINRGKKNQIFLSVLSSPLLRLLLLWMWTEIHRETAWKTIQILGCIDKET